MSEPAKPVVEAKNPTWDEVVCGNCPMWEQFPWEEKCGECDKNHESARGLCRLDGPKIVDGERGQWPVTNVDDWCGPGRDLVMGAIAAEQEDQHDPSS